MDQKSLSFLGGALDISASVMSAGASISSGFSSSSYYKYLSRKAGAESKLNTMLAGITAGIEQRQKASAFAGIQRNFKGVIGSQAAAMAANNVDSSSQYAQELAMSSAKAADRDMQAIEYNTNLNIFERNLKLALDNENARATAAMYEKAGKNALTSSYLNSAVSLFQGVGQVAKSWYTKYD